MRKPKKRKSIEPVDEAPLRAPVHEPPRLPEVERKFFELLLRELSAGMQEQEKDIRALVKHGALLRNTSRLRSTVAYARALLRLEELQRNGLPAETKDVEISLLLNLAVNGLLRSFLYAGVAVRRQDQEPSFQVHVPQEHALFLFEEMLTCCLRCAPEGKNIHVSLRKIGSVLLLTMRTEGLALQQSPLIPQLTGKDDAAAAPEEDYGFAMCRVLAAKLGWAYRWEADEAGVRMFLDII